MNITNIKTVQDIYDMVSKMDSEITLILNALNELNSYCNMGRGEGNGARIILEDNLTEAKQARESFLKQQAQIVGVR